MTDNRLVGPAMESGLTKKEADRLAEEARAKTKEDLDRIDPSLLESPTGQRPRG